MQARKVILTGFLLLVMLAMLIVGCAPKSAPATRPSHWPEDLAIGCKAAGSATYIVGTALAAMFEKHLPGTKAHGVPGPTEAVYPAMLKKGELHLGVLQGTAFPDVLTSTGEYSKPERAGPGIRCVFMGEGFFHSVLVRTRAGIRTLADIEGKRFMALKGGAIEREKSAAAILKLHNIPASKVTIQSFANYDELMSAFREGKTDASFNPITPGSSYVVDLITTGDAVLISWTDEEMKKYAELILGLGPSAIPAGSFKGQDKPIKMPYTAAPWIAYESLPEDLVYAMVKVVYANFDEFATYFDGAKQWRLPDAINPALIPGPMHEGAIRYYKEKGFWTSAHDTRQKELLGLIKK